jgi:catechol 2,3-dioxygenase-like lactoylglutathione lyase family enzyme
MITKYRHTGLVVNNLSKSRKFYCELLNFKIIQNIIEKGEYFNKLINEKNLKAKVIKAKLQDNIVLELLEFINAKKKRAKKPRRYYPVGTIHMCFTVKNINDVYKKLKKNKVKFLSSPLQSDFDDVITCFCYDPDFNLVQFVEGRQIRKKS